MEPITNSTLRQYKYSVEELEKYITDLNMKTLVNTQILTIDFCVRYVLNENYAQCNEEIDLLTVLYVAHRQPHLDKSELLDAYYKF